MSNDPQQEPKIPEYQQIQKECVRKTNRAYFLKKPEPGKEFFSMDKRTKYRIAEDGSWRKIQP